MKLKHIALAALVAVGSSSSFAAVTSEDSFLDGTAFVYIFGAKQIAVNETSFMFSITAADMDFASLTGVYDGLFGLSTTNYTISSVTIDGTPTSLGSNLAVGPFSLTGGTTEINIVVSGSKAGPGSNFNGQLVLTPVPEPETYALMLAGLAAVGFVAARRRRES